MRKFNYSAFLCTVLTALSVGLSPAQAQDAAGAWKLYGQRQYAASADAFEKVFPKAPPSSRLYYYAGLANREAQRTARARQLFDYVIANFATSPEAALAKAASAFLPDNKAASVVAASASPATAGTPAAGAIADANKVPVKSSSSELAKSKPHKKGDFPYSAEEIAREGANGIDQTNYPNCWFEAAMSALAQLPKGQRMLARMIRYGDGDSYIVRFPGDGVEYKITDQDLEASGVNCTAHWASLLDYAERLKFPHNRGAEGTDGENTRLANGLGCITGCRAEMLYPPQATVQEITSFIYGAVSSQNPITCGTANRNRRVAAPIIEGHAYTIIGFEPSRGMVLIRNPHGHKAQEFSLTDDPQHLRFEQLPDGVFKMNVELFKDSFGSVCRSFI